MFEKTSSGLPKTLNENEFSVAEQTSQVDFNANA